VLKRGSKEEAEDHPIRMSEWKWVWMEAFQASERVRPTKLGAPKTDT
jgi:hypothetical protein